jgi:ubiquitin carboxyl-terminal hydrolase 14
MRVGLIVLFCGCIDLYAGNTCYLNSVIQCLRAIPELRRGLRSYTGNPNNSGAAAFMESLRMTYDRLDRQVDAFQPAMLVQATRMAFPQFAQRGPHGQPMQQDAEEFYSGILTIIAEQTRGKENIRKGLTTVSDEELLGAENLVDALFGMKMKETLTCDEFAGLDADAASAAGAPLEPPVIAYDLHRKLVCNIQGGSDGAAQTNVSHVAEGIQLSLNGKIQKHSDVLGRDAVWTRQQRIARLPPVIAVQFGRFYWKATPDSQDHAGVKCKVMKPVAFNSTLDVYEFCTPEIQKVLKVARDKALAVEEDRINKKLKGELDEDDGAKMDTEAGEDKTTATATNDEDMGEEDADLQAALALSLEAPQPPVGPGLPSEFQGIYELFAVVTHKGRDADGGHYMAWVKADHNSGEVKKIADTSEDNEEWFVFDDDEVSPCKTEDILKLKGGGDWHMSYLNFYRVKK